MAHFARVENGIVQEVLVAEQDFIDNLVYDKPGEWIQTSYNTRKGIHWARDENGNITGPSEDQSKALRKNYAGIGYSYDSDRDAFIPPKEYDSWTLDEDMCWWVPPVAHPEDGVYDWNEETQTWDAVATPE